MRHLKSCLQILKRNATPKRKPASDFDLFKLLFEKLVKKFVIVAVKLAFVRYKIIGYRIFIVPSFYCYMNFGGIYQKQASSFRLRFWLMQ